MTRPPPGNVRTITYFPQEIIDLILDEVSRQGCRTTLQACSLVSRAFYLSSRGHEFSNIDMFMDDSCQARSSKLLKVLQHNRDLATAVRSLTLSFRRVPHLFREIGIRRAFSKSRHNTHRVLRRFGLQKNDLLDLLVFLSHMPLQALNIVGWDDGSRGPDLFLDGLESPLLLICNSSLLRTLHLVNIRGLPEWLLASAISSTSLRDLKLSEVFESVDSSRMPIRSALPESLAMLEKLEITQWSCSPLFSILRSTLSLPSATPRVFAHLRTLRVSPSKRGDWEQLGLFLLHSLPSLERFELLQFMSPTYYLINEGPTVCQLHRFPSLRHLELIFTCHMGSDFEGKQEALAKFLCALRAPITVTSITVDAYITFNLWDFEAQWKKLAPSPGWAALDDALTSPQFVCLRSVSFNIKAFHSYSGVSFGRSKAEGRKNAFTLLPVLASGMPWLDVEVNLESIFNPTAFAAEYLILQQCN